MRPEHHQVIVTPLEGVADLPVRFYIHVRDEREVFALRLFVSESAEHLPIEVSASYVRAWQARHWPPSPGWISSYKVRGPGVRGVNRYLCTMEEEIAGQMRDVGTYAPFFPELPRAVSRWRSDPPYAIPARLLVAMMESERPLWPVMERILTLGFGWQIER